MLSGRQLAMEDYIHMLRRRIWLILIPTVLAPLFAFAVARKLPPKYTSTSKILIDEPKVPDSFVPSLGENNLLSRLANMEEQIRSRSQLQPLIEQYGLYKDQANSVPPEELVAKMNAAIKIEPVAFASEAAEDGSGRNSMPGFQISFTADTPQLAQSICQAITSKFIDANIHLQTDRAQGTANFIGVELQQAKQKLDEQDAQLAAFQQKYFGSLPDQEQSTIQLIGNLSSQLNGLTESMASLQQQKTYDESLLSQQLQAWKQMRSGEGGSPETLEEQLGALEARLTTLRSHFTDSYPDVVKTKADIAALKAEIAQQGTAKASSHPKKAGADSEAMAMEPPQIRELRAQIQSLDAGMENNQAEQAKLRREVAGYQARLRLTPAVEQQYKDITRNYNTALAFYNNLLTKEDDSQMSTNLEQRQEGEQFTVLDPANLPQKPSFPNYWRFAGGGLLIGSILGLGFVFALELQDKAVRDERDIEYFLGVPTLGTIPVLDVPRRRLQLKGAPKRLAQAAKALGR